MDISTIFLKKKEPFATKRLFLRPLIPGDKRDIYTIYYSPEIRKWNGVDESRVPLLEAFDFSWADYQKYPFKEWAMIEKATGTLCGAFTLEVNQNNTGTALSYMLSPAFWGRGYMQEALRYMVDYLFENGYQDYFYIYIDHTNQRSCRLAGRCGFKKIRTKNAWLNHQKIILDKYILTYAMWKQRSLYDK